MIHDFLFYILPWWFLLFFLGIVFLPLTRIFLGRLLDRGYAFSKTVAVILVSYSVFVLGSLKILPFTFETSWIVVLLWVLFLGFLVKRNKGAFHDSKKLWKIWVLEEVLFFCAFLFWSFIRGFKPEIRGLEKFMDFGFINSILQSKYFPPHDMWLSGENINYYYFGHLYSAVLTRLSGIPSEITYNLLLATIFALVSVSCFSLVSTLTASVSKRRILSFQIFLFSILPCLYLVLGGNFHTPFYALKNGASSYWYPDATRFIGYNPDTPDKTIHEFPLYSFVVSDLHGHVLNLPFVLLFLALLWQLAAQRDQRDSNQGPARYLPLGFVLGVMLMTNAWDFVNYALVSFFVILLTGFFTSGFTRVFFARSIFAGVFLASSSLIFSLPFTWHFAQIAHGVGLVHNHSPLWQLGILWGAPFLISLVFLVSLAKHFKKLALADVFVLALLVSSWVLILIPEIIYVKDIYIASYYRANTMFKLTYQAFVLFAASSGYIFARSFSFARGSVGKIFVSAFFVFIYLAVTIYPFFAIRSFYNLKEYGGLSGASWVKNEYGGEYEAILWLKKNVSSDSIILEAVSESYTDYNLISSYTGLSTVVGWPVHEWLWRGSYDKPGVRIADVEKIYTSSKAEEVKSLLAQYSVDYIIVGALERQKYKDLREENFETLGKIVFESGETEVFKLGNLSL